MIDVIFGISFVLAVSVAIFLLSWCKSRDVTCACGGNRMRRVVFTDDAHAQSVACQLTDECPACKARNALARARASARSFTDARKGSGIFGLTNPNGVAAHSPGLDRGRGPTLGLHANTITNPNGVAALCMEDTHV